MTNRSEPGLRKRLIAAGLWKKPPGRPRRSQDVEGHCRICGDTFTYRRYDRYIDSPRKVCSKACARRSGQNARQKVPHDRALLERLYIREGRTTVELAQLFGVTDPCTVRRRLIQLGIRRRRAGRRKAVHCAVTGCSEPLHEIRHPVHGQYGRLCKRHWLNHRALLVASYRHKPGGEGTIHQARYYLRQARKAVKEAMRG